MAALLDAELVARGRARYAAERATQAPDAHEAQSNSGTIADTPDMTSLLRRDVTRLACQALEMQEDQLDPTENLANFGVDSIAITEVMVQISRFYGVSIAPTTFFEAKHLKHLSDILADRYAKQITAHYQAQVSDKATEKAEQPKAAKTPVMPAAWLERHKKLGSTLTNIKPVKVEAKAPGRVKAERPVQPQPASQKGDAAVEPIAIISMEGMFPNSPDIESLLENLLKGTDCIEEVPTSRWDWRKVEGDPKKGAFTQVKHGGFVPDHDLFDASFFNISPREAELIDPQHRLFMLSVWRLIEKAGYASSSLAGKKISIFLGINLLDHVDRVNSAGLMEAQQMTGLGHAFCPNRLSFMLDIHGPSEVVDTACSSSLVALHRAVMSIRHEGCEMAIAGGSNLMLGPKQHILFSKTGMLAADGRSKTFSKNADGYGRADGVGVVLLKPLSKAEADGDQILGLIKGSAEQHGGQGSSLTAPNSAAQARMIVEAHRRADVDPRSISYVECHGTGTPLGDPAEVEGLKLAFAQRYKDLGIEAPKGAKIGLGSIKSNIGHTETAAGVAGIIKILLSLQQKKLFKTLHCDDVNPLLTLEDSPFYLLQDGADWQSPECEGQFGPRTACISSFGAGGANAHVVIEEYHAEQRAVTNPVWSGAPAVVPLSAKNKAGLRQIVENILSVASQYDFSDLVYTLQVGRDAMRERAAFVASNTDELKEAILDYLSGNDNPAYHQGTILRGGDDHMNPAGSGAEAVAAAWVKGVSVDWAKYYAESQPKRLSLPLYPYALKRFSLPIEKGDQQETVPQDTPRPKAPLTPKAVSTTKFELELTGDEFFLTDHVILGQQILPGVAYLEMVQQAASMLIKAPITLKKTVWLKPMVVESVTTISIVFSQRGDSDWLAQVYAKTASGEQIEYAQIKVMQVGAFSAALADLDALKAQAGNSYSAEDIYRIFDDMKLSYGPGHRPVREIKCMYVNGLPQVLGKLVLPESIAGSLDQFALHPGLMDGAFQTVVGLGLHATSAPNETALPFAIDSVEYIKPLQDDIWVHVRATGAAEAGSQVQRSDIDLIAGDGSICVRLRGFMARLVKQPQAQPQETHIFKPHWSKVTEDTHSNTVFEKQHVLAFSPYIKELKDNAYSATLYDLGPLETDNIAVLYKDMASQILTAIQNIVKVPKFGPQLVQVVLPDDVALSPLTGIVGMLRTVRKEYPKVAAQLVSVSDQSPKAVSDILALAAETLEAPWLRLSSEGDLEQHQWDLREACEASRSVAFEDGKVYLITGGSGGIAGQLTRHILASAPNAHVVLTSRSAIDVDKLHWLKEDERRQVQYISADITVAESTVSLIDSIKKKHGHINGVFHAAGILDDGALLNKTEESLQAVLAPKVDGIVHLDKVLAGERLDFMILFSSIACALGNVGQTDYAAANGFLDGFARMREMRCTEGSRCGRTVSVAWPLWRDGGMQLSDDAVAGMTRTTGLTLLSSDAAIAAMMTLLSGESSHALVTSGDAEKITAFIKGGDLLSHDQKRSVNQPAPSQSAAMYADTGDMSAALILALKTIVSDELKVPVDELDVDEQLSEYGFDSIGFAQLANAINDHFNLDIIPTLFFECPSLDELSAYFISEYADQISEKLGISAPAVPTSQQEPAVTAPAAAPVKQPKRVEDGDDPVVIVGMSCQYPEAESVEEYWQNLLNNVDAISEIPADRWDWRDYWGDPLKEAGRTNIKWGGFIKNAGGFDPDFFGISRPEARLIDPQQRLLLQQTWRLFEDAGYAPKSFSGSDMGVFLGIADSAYSNIVARDVEQIEGYTMAGLAPSLGPNRISYFYNLHGPSVAVETACSSALVAVHRAIESIVAGRCSSAIAGGINLLLSPYTYIGFSKAGMLASDGRCKTFSADANGYARGEGLGLILLKRLSEAERAGDKILAIVRASGENHGGFATSLTAPNPKAQASLLRDVYRRSGVDPRTVSYIEAHGTGTPMGDPIEVEALTAAFKDLHREAEVQYGNSIETPARGLGSVKSNMGHLEIAAGIAGLMKVVLQMQAGTLVKSLHTETLNPYLKLDKGNFFVVDKNRPWQRVLDGDGHAQPFRAGVSSFGFGGSNAHVVLEEYIAPSSSVVSYSEPAGSYFVPISARTENQLQQSVARLKDYLAATGDQLSDIAYTLQVARQGMDQRIAIVAHSKSDLADKLSAYLKGQACTDLYASSVKGGRETVDILRNDDNFRKAAEQSVASGNYQTVASLWVRGFEVDWQVLNNQRICQKVALPGYPFETTSYWGAATAAVLPKEKPAAIIGATEAMPATNSPDANVVASVAVGADAILEKLVELAASVLEVDTDAIDVDAELGDFGFDSIVMTTFAGHVNETLDLDLSPADFFEFSTLAQLADHIAATADVQVSTAPAVPEHTQAISAVEVPNSSEGNDPVVIVGYSCNFPGARDADQFWQNLKRGTESISRVPEERWDWRALDGNPKTDTGKTNVHWGGFCDGMLEFDPAFFNISPREALLMDPQQRLLMTYVWKTIEDAGYDPTSFTGKKLAIFAGTAASDYRQLIGSAGGDEGYVATGSVASVGPNRMSYFLDVHGPSEPIETACSSSLVALHRAIRSLRDGECEAAIAGGVNTMLTPDAHINFSKAGMLSPDGHCKTFSKDANGYVRGEGVGFVLLKTLSSAKRDGDRILAIVKASGVNHGGHANSLTAPNTNAQAALLRDTYASAGVNAYDIGYIEAHGTGTALGDPVEINALKAAFGVSPENEAHYASRHCAIGSVKTNIGHLELAAGIAGIIKTLLQMEHKMLVPSLHSADLNPHIKLDGSPFRINQTLCSWEPFKDAEGHAIPRLAGVSSFGFGGVNAHIVLEEYMEAAHAAPVPPETDRHVFILSAKTESALREQAKTLYASLSNFEAKDARSIAFTLQVGRYAMIQRLAIVAASLSELGRYLQAYLAGETHDDIFVGSIPENHKSKTNGIFASDLPSDIASAWVEGQAIDWHAYYKTPVQRVQLPTYSFARDIYHIALSAKKQAQEDKPYKAFNGVIEADAFYLRDHMVMGKKILPGAMGLELVRFLSRDGSFTPVMLKNVSWRRPFELAEGTAKPQVSFTKTAVGGVNFVFEAADGGDAYMRGTIGNIGNVIDLVRQDIHQLQVSLLPVDAAVLYAKYQDLGIVYGSTFQVIENLYAGDGRVLAHLKLGQEAAKAKELALHPSILDGAFHAALALFGDDTDGSLALPIGLESIEVYRPLQSNMWAHLTVRSAAGGLIKLDIDLMDADGLVTAIIKSFTLKTLPKVKKPTIHEQENARGIEKPASLELYLTSMLSGFTDIPAEDIDMDVPLERYGMDSMLLTRMTETLEADFGELPATLFFDHLTLGSLLQYFADNHADKQAEIVSTQTHVKPLNVGMNDTSVARPYSEYDHPVDDIAIIGLSGRYPQADNLDEFWNNLVAGKDCITEIPKARWDHAVLVQAAKDSKLNIKSKWGGFVDGADRFDPLFFNISPAEAHYLDPQERLFMQCAWETIEDAGYTRQTLAPMEPPLGGSHVGVFVGVMWQEYQLYGAERYASGGAPIAMSGNGSSVANRVSYFCNFHGPSLTVDTMCSSSLTAIHLAVESIKSGSCSVALAGGVNLSSHSNKYVGLAQANFLSSNGKCESFGQGGDGYVPSEGVGAVLLKPLNKAVADKDQIYGVIRGSELNHGGQVNGYTVPNPHAQAAVISRALKRAGVDAGQIEYVEAHGTGTALGDPIEIAALTRAYESRNQAAQKCAIGSVKSNMGHAESAAGIAGLSKILLQFKHDQLVPSIHADTLNPKINFDKSPFRVQRENVAWKRRYINGLVQPRMAGLSSFGAGGSNAHFVVEDYQYETESLAHSGPYILPFSAHDKDTLKQVISRFRDFSKQLPDNKLASAAYCLQVGREAFDERIVLIVHSVADLAHKIDKALSSAFETLQGPHIYYGYVTFSGKRGVVPDASRLSDVARAWTGGAQVDWSLLWGEGVPVKISLPTYPFASDIYWVPGLEAPSRHAVLIEQKETLSLLYAPCWHAEEIVKPSKANDVRNLLVLCHVREEDSKQINGLVADDDLHVWHTGKPAITGNCYKEYAANLLELLKKATQNTKERINLRLVIDADHDGAYLRGLAGMLRSASFEAPHLSTQLIEYRGCSHEMLVSNISKEVQQPLAGGHIRYKDNERFKQYWREIPTATDGQMPWKDGGVYLITGGAGGIGLHMAREIAGAVKNASLWLIGRSTLSEQQQQEQHALTANVYYRQVDVTSEGDIRDLIQEIQNTDGKLDGVIHSAGLTRDGLLRVKTAQDLYDVLAPKVDGAINIDKAIGGAPLDFMLLMSSVAGALGNAGQTDYAAANAFLDGFASVRNRLTQQGQRQGRTLSMDWPYWRDGGITLDQQYIQAMERNYGVLPLELSEALIAVSTAFDSESLGQVLVLNGDHDRLRAMMASQVVPTAGAGLEQDGAFIADDVIGSQGPVSMGREAITAAVVAAFAETLSIPAARLDADKTFDRYGVDSVSALHILEPLSDVFGELPQAILFEYSTINSLVDYLYEAYGGLSVEARQDDNIGAQESVRGENEINMSKGLGEGCSPWLKQTPEPWQSPMGEGQRGIWIAQLMQPDSSVYNVPMAFQLKGIDEKLLGRACALLLQRYPILSVRVDDSEASAPMLLASPLAEALVHITMSKGVSAANFIKYRASIPFDLRKAGKIRFEFLTGGPLNKGEAILLVVAHHMVVDATSMATLAAELWQIYDDFTQGITPKAGDSRNALDYAHYIAWETALLQRDQGRAELAYWRDQLASDIQKLDLPFDVAADQGAVAKPETLECFLPSDVLESAEAAARLIGVSKASFFMGVFSMLLYKYTGQGAFTLGVPTMRRPESGFEKTVGYCANMIPLSVDMKGHMTTDVFFRSLHARLLTDLKHGNVPYSQIIRETAMLYGSDMLYQATFCYLNIGGGAETSLQFNQGSAVLVPKIRQSNDTFIGVDFFEHTKGVDAVFSYDGARFSSAFIDDFMAHFKTLLQEVIRQPSAAIANQTVVSPEEKKQQLKWCGKEPISKPSVPVLDAIRARAKETPDAPAIVCGENVLSYRDLMNKVNQLSRYFLSQGVRAEDTVAVFLERRADSIVTLLAVMSVGAVWLPLDSESPGARSRLILQNASVRLLITQARFDEKVATFGLKRGHIAVLENIEEHLRAMSDSDIELHADPLSAAYIIFTSGSTGEPKGVVVSHASIADHVGIIAEKYSLRNSDVVLQFASHSTDTSLEQILPTLACGSSLVMVGEKLLAPSEFYRLLNGENVTVADIPPAYLREILLAWRGKEVPEGLLKLRLILVGGEALTADLVSLWQNSILGCVKLMNAYGPTEATITTLTYEVTRDQKYGSIVPIGRPLDGVVAYILDDNGNIVPEGVKGELFLGGRRLALGYLGNDSLTAERFPLIDMGTNRGRQRLYRTGDRVSYLKGSNGVIVFHGRMDNQVKVRGYRVELGEIEAKILDYDDCNVAVLPQLNQSGDTVIVAYVEANSGTFDKAGLKDYLRRALPEHMVPNRIQYLENLPLSSSGKIDRVMLKNLELPALVSGYEQVSPVSDVEKQILDLWQLVLDDVDTKSINSVAVPFDQYGGNSLSAVRLMDAISTAFKVQLSYVELLSAPTVAQQAKIVVDKIGSDGSARYGDDPCLVPLQISNDPNHADKPLFLLHPIGGEVSCYLPLVKQLPPELSVYGIRVPEGENLSSVPDMAKRYLNAIKSVQPEGPYRIAGWSFGGLLAYEVAGLLSANQDEVSFVGLLDSYPYDIIEEMEGEFDAASSASDIFEKFSRDLLKLTEGYPGATLPASIEELASQVSNQKPLATIGVSDLQNMYDVFVNAYAAFKTHSLSSSELSITLFQTQNDYTKKAIRYWKSYTSFECKVYLMPGDHYSFLQHENLMSWVLWLQLELMDPSTSDHQKKSYSLIVEE
ncbi:non-ribosomal peptide synthetase [Kordiimonas pumila]|uniref:Non-ribosomal peptide synthetase n=1 Tax=Kordiimonas pumila TaxID=2161677 RepID=A0ABV7D3P4_9PROT|nr:non-ribosomal peptide synthetase [Kordiimonas pumila]